MKLQRRVDQCVGRELRPMYRSRGSYN